MKKFIAEFRKFIARGNVVDMAVGVIIGSAFSAIVTALTNKIIMPFINLLLSIGGENGLEKAYTFLKIVKDANGEIDLTKSIYIDWGAFITAIINFFLIALVLFIIMKAFTKADEMVKGAIKDGLDKDLQKERKEVRKQAKLEKRPFKDVWKEHEAEKARILAEKKAQEEANKPKVETQEELLKDIRDLLKQNQVELLNSEPQEKLAEPENK